MKKPLSKAALHGDHCFRAPFSGKSSQEIKREVARLAHGRVQRSIERGVEWARCEWPWLRRGLQETG